MRFERNRRGKRDVPVEIRIRSHEERCLGVRVAREDADEEEEKKKGVPGEKRERTKEGVN